MSLLLEPDRVFLVKKEIYFLSKLQRHFKKQSIVPLEQKEKLFLTSKTAF